MLKGKFQSMRMPFKEPRIDEEGNVVRNKNGEIVYTRVWRVVRYRAGYFPKK